MPVPTPFLRLPCFPADSLKPRRAEFNRPRPNIIAKLRAERLEKKGLARHVLSAIQGFKNWFPDQLFFLAEMNPIYPISNVLYIAIYRLYRGIKGSAAAQRGLSGRWLVLLTCCLQRAVACSELLWSCVVICSNSAELLQSGLYRIPQ